MGSRRLMTAPLIAVLAVFSLLALPALASPITIYKNCTNCSADAFITGFGTNTIWGEASVWGEDGDGFAVIDMLGYTRGPVRDGIIQIRGSSSPSWGPGGYGSASFNVGGIGCSYAPDCINWYDPDLMYHLPSYHGEMRLDAEFPFTLGVPFQIYIAAYFYASGEPGTDGTGGGASFDFSLFDDAEAWPGGPPIFSRGDPVMVFDAADVPEPDSMTLVGLGFGVPLILAYRRFRRPRSSAGEAAVSPSHVP